MWKKIIKIDFFVFKFHKNKINKMEQIESLTNTIGKINQHLIEFCDKIEKLDKSSADYEKNKEEIEKQIGIQINTRTHYGDEINRLIDVSFSK